MENSDTKELKQLKANLYSEINNLTKIVEDLKLNKTIRLSESRNSSNKYLNWDFAMKIINCLFGICEINELLLKKYEE